jgi:hypothetical protein
VERTRNRNSLFAESCLEWGTATGYIVETYLDHPTLFFHAARRLFSCMAVSGMAIKGAGLPISLMRTGSSGAARSQETEDVMR